MVDAAIPLINEKGVAGMTLQEVAQALDLTTTSVTYYYRYKEQLAAAVFEDTLARLLDMAEAAKVEASPRERVATYMRLFFEQYARALRGQDRPLAVLSEIRALEEAARRPLLEGYRGVFRTVRSFFGEAQTMERKAELTARAHMLNEALFWTANWLRNYSLADMHNVRRRMFDVLESGLASAPVAWDFDIVNPDTERPKGPKREFLAVASRLINDIGYRGASIERIVGEMKITKGSFYHHVDAKDDLILDCYRDDFRRLARLRHTLDEAGGDVATRLVRSIGSALALQFDGTHPLLRTTALAAMPATVRAEAIRRFDRLALLLSGLIIDGMREGSVKIVDPAIAANLIISSTNSAYDLKSWASRQDTSAAIRTYAGILMYGIFDPPGCPSAA